MSKKSSESAQRRREKALRRKHRQARAVERHSKAPEALSMAVFDEMIDEIRQQGLVPDAEVRFNPPGQMKMSEALEVLIDPFVEATTNTEQLEKLVTLAMMAWNACIMPSEERAKFVQDIADTFPREVRADGMNVLRSLMRRKMMLFPNDGRLIIDAHVTDLGDQYHIAVASWTPGEAPASP